MSCLINCQRNYSRKTQYITTKIIDMPKLKLTRPLAVFDIESTGINRKSDRIIDLSIIKIIPDESLEKSYFRVNPGVDIPPETTAIHGITDADVKDAPSFKDCAEEILEVLKDCDLGGYNCIHFDIPMLEEEFQRAGYNYDTREIRVVDAQRIFHQKEPRDLTAAVKFYAGEELQGAHNAENDVMATIKVIHGQLAMYDDLPEDVEGLDTYCHKKDPSWLDRSGRFVWKDGNIIVNFSKYKGETLENLAKHERGFLTWIIKNDFPRDVQDIAKRFLDGALHTDFK